MDSSLSINSNISIIRDYSSGSKATTLLCMNDNGTFYRKYAFGLDGEKLFQQIEWIERYNDQLPLPSIIRKAKSDNFCFYDMPYISHSVDLFEFANSMDVSKTWSILERILKKLESTIYSSSLRKTDVATIEQYCKEKIDKKLASITSSVILKDLLKYDTLIINGKEYNNLPFYTRQLSSEYLIDIFSNDVLSVIHGDLTFDNIICMRNDSGFDEFYLIDPNTGNIHDSKCLDYAKLLQSLHGGYEFILSSNDTKVTGNQIEFNYTRSTSYSELYSLLKEFLTSNFDESFIRSVYFHEIVHWIRLVPYQIEKNNTTAIAFYSRMIMLMNEIIEAYR